MESTTRKTRARRSSIRLGGEGDNGPKRRALPSLAAGDRLTLQEFEQRYQAMPESVKAELIEGVVHVPSPVTLDYHGENHFDLNGWLFLYRANTPGVRGGDNTTVKSLKGPNQPQPDSFLAVSAEWGGRCWTDEDGYLHGPPEFIGEIAASSASYDLHDKFGAYQRNGVREYVVWRVEDRAIDWFILRGDKFRRMPADEDHVYRSRVFPGLWLDARALIEGDLQKVLHIAQQGIQSDEHRKFVARLVQKRGKK